MKSLSILFLLSLPTAIVQGIGRHKPYVRSSLTPGWMPSIPENKGIAHLYPLTAPQIRALNFLIKPRGHPLVRPPARPLPGFLHYRIL